MKKEFFGAVWTLVGIVIGAGVFGLPYVFYKAGVYTGVAVTFLAFLVMTFLTLYLGEVCLRTKGFHQLTGLAEKYLGKKGKWFMFTANVLSIYGALAAYIIGAGLALNSIFGTSEIIFSILFFVFVAPFVYFAFSVMEGFETVFVPVKILIVFALSFVLLKFIDFGNISSFSFYNMLIPYGVAIFAFAGISAVPEMNEELKNKRYMFSAIIAGMVISLFINLLFAISVVGALGPVAEVATVSLSKFGNFSNIFANLFAFFALATAFVALGFALKENFSLDLKIPNAASWGLAVFVPLLISLSGLGFIKLLDLVGAVAVGFILIMIMIIHSKAKKTGERKPEYSLGDYFILKLILFLILASGIIYSVFTGF